MYFNDRASDVDFHDRCKSRAGDTAACDCLMQCERDWLGAAERMKNDEYGHAVFDAIVATAQSCITLNNEFIVFECTHVGVRGKIGRYLAAYAIGKACVVGFKHRPSRRVINRLDDLQAQAPNWKAGEATMGLAAAPHGD